jgi:hypothetical protein
MMAVETEVSEHFSWTEKVLVYRPRFGKVHISRSTLDLYEKVDDDEEAKDIWEEDYHRNVNWGRVKTYHIITGAVVSLWPTIHEAMRKFATRNHLIFSLRVIRAKVLEEEEVSLNDDKDYETERETINSPKSRSQDTIPKERRIIGLNIDERFITDVRSILCTTL